MKYTVTEISTSNIKVQYPDGSHAVIPIVKGQSKETIEYNIIAFNQESQPFDKVSDVPVELNKEIEVNLTVDNTCDYKEARRAHYPAIGTQLDALYWDRQGDDTQKKAIDARIKLVKDTITKDKTYDKTKLDTLLD
tara:strand:+ start:2000 stop:2407 length:408 start_codon:yes stop_codon:yes gene_type:complete